MCLAGALSLNKSGQSLRIVSSQAFSIVLCSMLVPECRDRRHSAGQGRPL